MTNFEYYNQRELWEKDFLTIPAERERIASTIELIPPDVRTILDVGCGNGAFLNSLPDKYQAVGLDSSQEALKHVKTKAIHGDIAALPFESASFDLVTCLEVLEHLPSSTFEKALRELQRVSKKYIIISVPNNEDLDYHLVICPKCRCWYNPYRHVRSFNLDGLKHLFERFALLEVKEIGPLEPHPRYNKYIYAAYRLWRNTLPPNSAVCPQCGHKVVSAGNAPAPHSKAGSNPLTCAFKLLKLLAKIIWRPQWRRRWLLALYMKKDSGIQQEAV